MWQRVKKEKHQKRLLEFQAHIYVTQGTSWRYIVFHVGRVSLSYTRVLYTIRLGFERRLIIIYVCLPVYLSVRPSVAIQTVITHSLKTYIDILYVK